jgi:hypothetical protein
MDSFSVESNFTAADWRRYQAAVAQKVQGDGHLHFQILEPQQNGPVLGPRTILFGNDGLTIQRSNTSAFISWSLFKEVEVDSQHLFVWLEQMSAVMLSLQDLPVGMTAEEATRRIRVLAGEWAAARSNETATLSSDGASAMAADGAGTEGTLNYDTPTATPSDPAHSATAQALAAGPGALRRALGFLTLRPGSSVAGAPSDWAITGFTVGSLILWLALDRLRYGHDAEFVPYDAPGFSWYMLPCLLAAWLASRLTRPRVEIRQIIFLLVVLAPVLIGCVFLLGHNIPAKLLIAVVVALAVYAIVYLEVGLRALAGRRQRAAATVIIAIALLFVSVNSTLFVYPTLWSDPEPDTADFQTRAQKAEDLLISQGPRIEAEVGRIAASHPGVYFVGFAGVGRQRVFAEEIMLAAQRIAERYDSAQREILLVNDRRDVELHPLATVEGLKLALHDVAAKMDVERDVLFLSLSSHGDDEPSLSVSNTGMSLRDLSGSELADALHASGIKWKVIVISACHAGAFIDALRDDNTFVLTAAAADRTSFGCSDDRDLTYFGEAFYRDALPQSATLQEAFSRAAADIAGREQREGIRASKPQAFFGTALEKKMAEIDSTAHCNNGCRQSVPESSPIRSTQQRDHTTL